jgi:plasmid stability protein
MEPRMGSISVRKLDEETMEGLRVRAARHGVSMEEEVRRLIRQAVAAPEKLGDLMYELFGPENGVDLDLPKRGSRDPIEFPE